MKTITFADALREAHAQLLRSDSRVFVLGQGVWSPWYAGTSLKDLDKEFGRDRIIDSPVSENAATGAAIGAAMAGMRPIVFHPRMDFMLLATDTIVNQAANWSYIFAGQVSVPVTIRATIARGGEQGARRSQAFQALYAHVPGLKVVMPSTPYDVKGLLIAAVNDGNPIIFIDDRWLYAETGEVPEEMYEVPIGKAAIRRKGKDVTIVATSTMSPLSLKAADELARLGIDAEVIDLRTIKPWDKETVFASIRSAPPDDSLLRTPRGLLAAFRPNIAACVAGEIFDALKAPIIRVTLPDLPAPTSNVLGKGLLSADERYRRTAARETAVAKP